MEKVRIIPGADKVIKQRLLTLMQRIHTAKFLCRPTLNFFESYTQKKYKKKNLMSF